MDHRHIHPESPARPLTAGRPGDDALTRSLDHPTRAVSPSGFVWLVGAGPGAADLITVRGRAALAQAQAVVHDDLAGGELLGFCPRDCQRFYVGKRAGCHSRTQEEINRLLVEHARAGRRVVRLKGGDPTVFGRLGEELQALRLAQVPHEIIPGVTAACAAAAAAGISLTQRGIASAAVLATGHECAGKEGLELDWAALAQPNASLCVYMGTRNLGILAERLMMNGHPSNTPVLIVSNASRPGQIIRSGTLETAAELAIDAVGSPSLVLIGASAASTKDGPQSASRSEEHRCPQVFCDSGWT